MKIAIIAEVFLPKIDGVVGRTVNLIRQLQRHGDEVVVFCPEVGEPRNAPVPVVSFPSFPFPQYPEYLIGQPDQRLWPNSGNCSRTSSTLLTRLRLNTNATSCCTQNRGQRS